MVYFGRRSFRNTRPGLTSRDKVHLALPFILLVGAVIVLFALRSSSRLSTLPEALPEAVPWVQNEATNQASPGAGRPASGPAPRREQVLTLPPLPDPNTPPEPFLENDFLDAVEDGVERDGLADVGLIGLFHRWRSGDPQPLRAEVPEYSTFPSAAPRFRGERFRLYLNVELEPIPRELPPNPSGVRRYWEVWGSDSQHHLHRVLCWRKEVAIPVGSSIECEADFLRLHRYHPVQGGVAQVPEWVAASVEPWVAPSLEYSWQPFLWTLGIGVVSLVLLVGIALRRPRPLRR